MSALTICLAGNLYYFLSITLFFTCLGPILRRNWGVANTLRFWEFYVSVGWQAQTLAFWVKPFTI